MPIEKSKSRFPSRKALPGEKEPARSEEFEVFFDDTKPSREDLSAFTGFWVYSEILLLDDLTAIDKLILSFMLSLWRAKKEFFASNLHLQTSLKISRAKVSGGIKKLQKLGYIQMPYMQNDKRYIKGSKKLFSIYAKCLEKENRKAFPERYKRRDDARF